MTENFKKGAEIAQQVSAIVNSNNKEAIDGFIETLARDHRTLQAEEIIIAIRFLKKVTEFGTDARNEMAVKFADLAIKGIENHVGYALNADKQHL